METYRRINDEYVGESEPEELLEGAIEGMFETLDDPYSAYLGPDEFDATFADISGEFEGIGARMAVEDVDGEPARHRGEPAASASSRCCRRHPRWPPACWPAMWSRRSTATALEGRTHRRGGRADPRAARQPRSASRSSARARRSSWPSRAASSSARTCARRSLADGRVGYLRIDGFSSNVGDDFETALREHLDAGVAATRHRPPRRPGRLRRCRRGHRQRVPRRRAGLLGGGRRGEPAGHRGQRRRPGRRPGPRGRRARRRWHGVGQRDRRRGAPGRRTRRARG